ncbi:MAG: glycosyltransferase, partial [Nitrospirae bacterium]|nr:glycosyltransferase [Nitrospirota bacterium]
MDAKRDIRHGANPLPSISVITPTLNQGRYIEHTIQSVIAQDYPNFEHIVIDGGSTDNTIEVLRRYPHLKWISEKDNGQSDALNKGVARAGGDIIAWLNSDDYYCPNAFYTIAMTFEIMPHAKVIVAQTLYLFESTMESFLSRNRELTFEDMIRYWDHCVPPTQPSVFFKTDILKETGLFDASLHYTMDFDMWLKMSLKHVFYSIPDVLAVYRFHDKSKSGFAEWSSFFPEYNAVYKRYKKHSSLLPEGPLTTMVIPFSREALETSHWYLEKIKNTLLHLSAQKVHDIEVIVISDADAAQQLLDLKGMPFPARFVGIPKMDTVSFYHALVENAGGFTVHCPSIEVAFDFNWFSTALTFLLVNKDFPLYITDIYQNTLPLSSDNNDVTTMGIAMPNTHMLIRTNILKIPNPFEYPQDDAPLITFIVSVYDEVTPLLYLSLFSIYERCVDHPYEVHVVAGTTHTANYIRGMCNAAVREVEDDQRRFHALNDIANSTTGKYLFFISSTILLTPSSVPEVLRTFTEHPHAGIVGAKTIFVTGGIDNAACVLFSDGSSLKYGWNKPNQTLDCEYLREVDFFTLDFIAINRQAWSETNGFDTMSCPVSLLEANLCFNIDQLGYSVLYQPEAEVSLYRLHKPNLDKIALRKYEHSDFTRFKQRWQNRLKYCFHTYDESLIARASVSGNRPWVLLLCYRLPMSQSSAGEIGLVLHFFKEAGFNVAIHTEEVDPVGAHRWLTRAGVKVFYNDIDFYDFTKDNVLHFDAIWLEDRSMALYRSTIIRRLSGSVVLIYDASDITPDEDLGEAFFRGTNLSNLDRIQIARDRLIATMVDIVYTRSEGYGRYLMALNQDLVVGLTPLHRNASHATEVLDLIGTISNRTTSGKRIISGQTAGGFTEIIKMENAIREIAICGLRDIVDNCGQRPLYIWGAGTGGIQTRRMLASMGASAMAFLDKSPQKQLTTVDGLPVYDPVAVLKTPA